jgi:hypothetical protein
MTSLSEECNIDMCLTANAWIGPLSEPREACLKSVRGVFRLLLTTFFLAITLLSRKAEFEPGDVVVEVKFETWNVVPLSRV